MIKSLKGKKKGFSLVELIVVIAIIGILAAIAVPKYSQYKNNSVKKSNEATAKLIADATIVYADGLGKTVGELDSNSDKKITANDDDVVLTDLTAYISDEPDDYEITIDDDGTLKVTVGTSATQGEYSVKY